MLSVLDLTRVKRLLCLGAHCDDIEIGAGGTILHLAKLHPELEVKWVVFAGESPVRVEEARRSAEVFLAGTSTKSDIVINGFRDGFFPFQGELIKEAFEDLKSSFTPDLILTHHDDDRHQDHRLVSQLTWNTWRDHMILEYEIMKYDGDLGRPNVFVPLSRTSARTRSVACLRCFHRKPGDNGSTRRRSGRCCGCAASNATRLRGLPKRSSCARSLLSPRAFGEHPKHPRLASFRRRPSHLPQRWYHRLQSLKDVTSPLRACRGKTSLASCLRRKLKDSISPALLSECDERLGHGWRWVHR